MGIRQAVIMGGLVATGIGVLYRKLDRDAQRHQANFEKTLREGLFRHGLHNDEALVRDNPDAVAYDEHGRPLTTAQVASRVAKRAIGDPARAIRDSIKDSDERHVENHDDGKW